MLATFTRRLTILLATLLLVAAPSQADSTDETLDEATPLSATLMGNLTMTTESATEDTESCQLVDYSLSKPTAITPDPDRCFIPYILGQIPI